MRRRKDYPRGCDCVREVEHGVGAALEAPAESAAGFAELREGLLRSQSVPTSGASSELALYGVLLVVVPFEVGGAPVGPRTGGGRMTTSRYPQD